LSFFKALDLSSLPAFIDYILEHARDEDVETFTNSAFPRGLGFAKQELEQEENKTVDLKEIRRAFSEISQSATVNRFIYWGTSTFGLAIINKLISSYIDVIFKDQNTAKKVKSATETLLKVYSNPIYYGLFIKTVGAFIKSNHAFHAIMNSWIESEAFEYPEMNRKSMEEIVADFAKWLERQTQAFSPSKK
jgi:hypothetical protein